MLFCRKAGVKSKRGTLSHRLWPTVALAVLAFAVLAALPGIEPGGARRLAPVPARKPFLRAAFEVAGVCEPVPPGTGDPVESASFSDLADRTEVVNAIVGEWYAIDSSGRVIESGPDGATVGFARSSGDAVWAMVTLPPPAPPTIAFLTSASARQALARSLVATAVAEKYDGLVVNLAPLLEGGTVTVGQAASAFLTEVRRASDRLGLSLGVVIPALTAPREQAYPIDPGKLAATADWLILQGWGEHWPEGIAGPISGRDWLNANLSALVARVFPGWVSLAIPAFAYDWPTGGTGAVRRAGRDAAAIRAARGSNSADDPVSGEAKVTYATATGESRTIWYLDAPALAERSRLARFYGLRGIVVWRLGEEDQAWWPALGEEVEARPR